MKNTYTEKELTDGLKRGDNNAFRKLFDLYYHPLYCIARQYTGDDFTADTLVGDLFFHLWEVRATLYIKTSLHTYLIRSIRNYSINFLQKGYVNREVALNEINQYMFSTDEYPLGILLEKELSEKVEEEIRKLPTETRQVFIMSRFEELNYPEIADRLGISVNTVKYHMKKALALLREGLKEYLPLILLLMNF